MGTWSLGKINVRWPEGHPQHGLEVCLRRRPVGEVLEELKHPTDRPTVSDEAFEAMTIEERARHSADIAEFNLREFAELLISWNFVQQTTVNGELIEQPILADYEGLLEMDNETVSELRKAYDEATTRVAPPLPQPSDAGVPLEEALTLPQEPL